MALRVRRLGWPLFASALLSLAAMPAHAADLQVTPTSVTVPAQRGAEGLTLSNSGAMPLHAQVRVFRWTQVDGEERLEPTRDVAISPPMLELPGGTRQLVRIVRLGPPPSDGVESSYRVMVDELPVAGSAEQTGLRFVLQYSIPVFLSPAGGDPVAPRLQARLAHEGGTDFLQLDNEGNGHAQVADLAFVAGDQRLQIAPGLSGYVLPRSRKRWSLPAGFDPSQPGAFMARINGEAEERTLVVHAPTR